MIVDERDTSMQAKNEFKYILIIQYAIGRVINFLRTLHIFIGEV